jgi:hypothetical protein
LLGVASNLCQWSLCLLGVRSKLRLLCFSHNLVTHKLVVCNLVVCILVAHNLVICHLVTSNLVVCILVTSTLVTRTSTLVTRTYNLVTRTCAVRCEGRILLELRLRRVHSLYFVEIKPPTREHIPLLLTFLLLEFRGLLNLYLVCS